MDTICYIIELLSPVAFNVLHRHFRPIHIDKGKYTVNLTVSDYAKLIALAEKHKCLNDMIIYIPNHN